ncbi:MAG: hypothetical protein EPO09_21570 [Aquabacterium sp.]|uniref:hypothetical protein n=1 Tax=Aquabacterium sp. TaxID=1872578 RepID=UPI00121346EE|nr:hypothetical protein [Aquabacterium sp.]TAK82635.1 MAG: hypothetical protein EPO09_21570 [Aquabacterium sp.]
MVSNNREGQQDDDAVVSYSVKELLQDIKGSVDKLYGKIDSKADYEQVEDLARQVVDVRSRVDRIELDIQVETERQTALTEWRRYAIPTVLTVALLVVAVAQWITTK